MQWSLLLANLNKPYYFFRPSQGLRRLWRMLARPQPVSGILQVNLPWGLALRINPREYIGAEILEIGLYDLCVSEVLWRLLEPGETAIDAGANIGQMTSIMALRVGSQGKVISFEPHPQVFPELAANAALWKTVPECGQIELHEMGLSNESGAATLHVPANPLSPAISSLETAEDFDSIDYSVPIGRLTEIVDADVQIGVMKVDVEGHELKLLQGAADMLANGRVRDIVFEELQGYPSPVTRFLEDLGYTILSIAQGPFGVIVAPAQRGQSNYSWLPQNYVATRDASRALKRLRKPGYQVLRNQLEGRNAKVIPAVAAAVFLLLAGWFFARRKR